MPTEYDRLIQPLTEPERPRLAEVQATVQGVNTASEAWERLAARGLIPLSWINSTERGYVQPVREDCKCCHGSGMTNGGWSNCYECNAVGTVLLVQSNLTEVFEAPQDVPTCAAMAAMSDRISTAEVLVREFAKQLAQLGIEDALTANRAYRWRNGFVGAWDGMERGKSNTSAIDDSESPYLNSRTFHAELNALLPKVMQSTWGNQSGLVRGRACRLVHAHASWETRAKRGERLRSEKSVHCGKLLSELTNPYTVALEVCALGLAIEDVINGVAFLLVPSGAAW